MFYNKKWINLNHREMGFLILSVVAWVLLTFTKQMMTPEIDLLPLPLGFFWGGIGALISMICFVPMIGLHFSISKIICTRFKDASLAFLIALCGLFSIEFYFYHLGKEPLYFFLWAPVLTLIFLLIILSPQKKLIRLRLFLSALGIGVAIFYEGHLNVSNLSTFLLVIFILLTRFYIRRGGNILQIFSILIFLKGSIGGIYSLLVWGVHEQFELQTIYHFLFGGMMIGLALLFFMKSIEEMRTKELFLLSFTPLLTRFDFPSGSFSGAFPYFLSFAIVAASMILTRTLLRERKLVAKL